MNSKAKEKKDRIFVLNEILAPRICPELAKEIGLNESIVLLQLEFWISTSGQEIDGEMWIYESINDLREAFPFWSRETINRIINSLKKSGYLKIGNYNKKAYDRTRWFALDKKCLSKLKSIKIAGYENNGSSQNETRSSQNETRSSQNETTIPDVSPDVSPEEKEVFDNSKSELSKTSAEKEENVEIEPNSPKNKELVVNEPKRELDVEPIQPIPPRKTRRKQLTLEEREQKEIAAKELVDFKEQRYAKFEKIYPKKWGFVNSKRLFMQKFWDKEKIDFFLICTENYSETDDVKEGFILKPEKFINQEKYLDYQEKNNGRTNNRRGERHRATASESDLKFLEQFD